MKRFSLFAAILLAVAGIGCADPSATAGGSTSTASVTAPAVAGSAAPAFSLEDQSGNKVSLSDFAGKIVVLEWINPDCPFVVRHAKAQTMKALADKYAGKNVVWVGINSTHYANKETNAKWISSYSLPYIVLDDHMGEVGRAYGAKTTPHMYIIDGGGNLVYQGGIDDDPQGSKGGSAVNYVDKALEELTSGKQVSMAQTKPYGCSVKYKS